MIIEFAAKPQIIWETHNNGIDFIYPPISVPIIILIVRTYYPNNPKKLI